ncbi:MAG: hypothetical protein AVDCRST_MAG67-2374 [uncultured Solirubrobacteraceae bacterium]|uniref:Uncharacterized protein n=1 Tax=uncultured Solirubrobacteraceae bacterium TaxID=1162706 RepID=A0A6J4SU96_9ACTN|nr:MAG: hypothetical protein AVDCRST_MAG67-2374 [uncultured Solirubrobacteraceae bacterium]
MEEDEIRVLVKRLARPHPSGGTVIERAAIMAEGTGSTEVLSWILARGAVPEAAVERESTRQGLHGVSDTAVRTTSRFVLPAGALD